MSVTDMIYKIIDEKCLKQSAVARAAGYDPKKFNALLRGRKILTSDDVVPILRVAGDDGEGFNQQDSTQDPESDAHIEPPENGQTKTTVRVHRGGYFYSEMISNSCGENK